MSPNWMLKYKMELTHRMELTKWNLEVNSGIQDSKLWQVDSKIE